MQFLFCPNAAFLSFLSAFLCCARHDEMAWGSCCYRKWFVCSRAVKLLPSAEANVEILQDPSEKKKNHLPLALTLLVLQGGQGVQWLFGQAVTFSLCFLHPQKSSREELMEYREGCPRSRVSFPAPQSVSHRCKNLTLGLCYPS